MREIIDLESKEEVVPPIETTQKQQGMTGKSSGKTPVKMTVKTLVKIIGLLKDNPSLSIPELAEKLEKSKSATERAIRKLRQSGLLKRIGPDKGGYWDIVKIK